jgi:hypothetical protein
MYRRRPTTDNQWPGTQLPRRNRNIVLSLAAAAPAAALLISSCAPSVPHKNLTVHCSETLTGQDVADGGVAGTGRCALTGALRDNGRVTDYRTQRGQRHSSGAWLPARKGPSLS